MSPSPRNSGELAICQFREEIAYDLAELTLFRLLLSRFCTDPKYLFDLNQHSPASTHSFSPDGPNVPMYLKFFSIETASKSCLYRKKIQYIGTLGPFREKPIVYIYVGRGWRVLVEEEEIIRIGAELAKLQAKE
jgi:hypothetical protein